MDHIRTYCRSPATAHDGPVGPQNVNWDAYLSHFEVPEAPRVRRGPLRVRQYVRM